MCVAAVDSRSHGRCGPPSGVHGTSRAEEVGVWKGLARGGAAARVVGGREHDWEVEQRKDASSTTQKNDERTTTSLARPLRRANNKTPRKAKWRCRRSVSTTRIGTRKQYKKKHRTSDNDEAAPRHHHQTAHAVPTQRTCAREFVHTHGFSKVQLNGSKPTGET